MSSIAIACAPVIDSLSKAYDQTSPAPGTTNMNAVARAGPIRRSP